MKHDKRKHDRPDDDKEAVADGSDPGREADETLTDKIQAHPAASVAGGVSGAVVGTVVGLGAGPVGAALGAAAGAAVGALRGSGARQASEVSTTREDAHWREHFAAQPYTGTAASYEDYGPAYRYAVDEYQRKGGGLAWADVEARAGGRMGGGKGPVAAGLRAGEAGRARCLAAPAGDRAGRRTARGPPLRHRASSHRRLIGARGRRCDRGTRIATSVA